MKYQEVCELIKAGGLKLKLPQDIIEQILEPKRIVEVSFPVKMRDGKFKVFKGYRVQHSDARGPYKGGIRYHPDANLEEVKVLAALMSLKTALINIPFGGSKGGVEVDPRGLTDNELKAITRGFARSISDVIGERRDVPAPDLNTNSQIMKWFRQEYEKMTGRSEPGVITGKSVSDGGIKVRDEATGLGGAAVCEEIAKTILKKKNRELTVAIQGFGNVGNHLAHHLYHMGFKIVAVADVTGGITHEDGLDYHMTAKETKKGKNICELCHCDIHGPSNDCGLVGAREVLEENVDILIPAAIGNQITHDNADKIRAKVIVEMANRPVDERAETVLDKKGILIVPDILANAGGVLASYFEWDKNVHGVKMSYNESKEKLIKMMRSACRDVLRLAAINKITMRQAAYMIAIERIVRAIKNSSK
jgi:glutamate dehydrogenase